MENSKLIAEFIIPEYLREVQVSKKQRPKYYTWDGITIKSGSKKLLQKYINPKYKEDIIVNNGNVSPVHLKHPYYIVRTQSNKVIGMFKSIGLNPKPSNMYQSLYNKLTYKQKLEKPIDILINFDTYKRVIANETQAGKPKRIIIKGQDMYSGVLNEFTRAKIVKELKEDYYKKIGNHPLLQDYTSQLNIPYPVRIEMELVDTIKNHYDRTKEGDGIRWDVGNRAYPYIKTFVDFLCHEYVVDNKCLTASLLIDDDRTHVEGESYFFTPCEKHEDRKLIFRIYKK